MSELRLTQHFIQNITEGITLFNKAYICIQGEIL